MNATNGRIDADPIESRGGPPTAVPEGADANKLAAAKDAAKKKLLRLVVQQAAEELGDPEAIVEQAFRDGLFSEELISGLRAGVRDRMTRRLIDHIAQEGESGLAADAALALADAPEVKAAVDSVERKLAGTIAAKALERMEDEAAIADSIFDQIARVNDETISALSEDVRLLVVQSIADRAWASSVDPDEILKVAETRIDPNDPAIAAAVEKISAEACEIATRQASEAARERVIRQVAEEVTGASLAQIAVDSVHVDESIIEQAALEIRRGTIEKIQARAEQGLSEDAVTTGLAEEATRRVENLVMERVREEVRASGIEDRVSEAITEAVSGRIAESVFETDEILKHVENRLKNDGVRMQEAAERARAEFAVQLTDDLIAAVTADEAIDSLTAQAVAEVRVRVAQDVSARVAAIPAEELASEAAIHLDRENEQVLAAIGAARVEIIKDIAQRAESSLADSGDAARQALDAFSPDEAVLTEAGELLRAEVISMIVGRVAEDLSAHGITSRDAVASEVLEASSQALRKTILDQIVASVASAKSRTELRTAAVSDPAIAHLLDETREEVRATLAASISSGLAAIPAEELASEATIHFDRENEQVLAAIGTARVDILKEIARRAESSLADSGDAARQALTTFAPDDAILTEAGERLRAEVISMIAGRVAADLAANGITSHDASASEALEATSQDLRKTLLDQIVASVSSEESRTELRTAAISDPALAHLVDETHEEVWATLAARVSSRVLSSSPDQLASAALARVEPDAAPLVAAGEAVHAQLVRLIAEQATTNLADVEKTAAEALAHVPDDDRVLIDAMAALKADLTKHVADRVLDDLEQNGIPTDDPRMTAAAQSVRTLVSGILYAQAMKVATTSKERDRIAQEVARDVHDLLVTDTIEAFSKRNPADLAEEARSRMADSNVLVNEASDRLADVMAGHVARLAEAALRTEGVDFDHPTVAAVMFALQSDVRVAIAERAYQAVADSDTKTQLAADIVARVHDAVTSEALRGILGRNPAEMAQAIAAQISEDEPVIARATESVMTSLRADVTRSVISRIDADAEADLIARSIADDSNALVGDLMHSVAESLREYAKDRAVEEVATSDSIAEITSSGYDVLRDRLVVSIAQRSASIEAADLAGEAASLLGESPLVAEEATTLLHARMVESIAAKAVDQLGSVAAASEKARIIAESEDTVVEDAVRTVYDLLASQVGEEVTRRIHQTDRLAQTAASFVDPDDPAVDAAADDVTNDLGRLVAVRAVDQLSSAGGRARIVAEATGACSDEMESSVREAEDALLQTIVARIATRFTDAGDTARRAQEKLGTDHAPLIAAGEVLKELVLEDLSRKATIMLLDASQAADRAFSRIDLDDPRFQKAQDTLRTRIVDAVAERSLQALEDVDSAAGMVRARIPEDHEHVVGTAALVRDMLLDDIARRSEASLNDTRTAARLSRQRVPENSVNLASASEALRDLLLDDLVHLATSAFGDAAAAAEQAMLRVDGDEDVLVRARAAFKERILMSVLGEAIREIGGAFGSGRADAQQAVFQQAMTAMARQTGSGQQAPDRSPIADISRPAPSDEAHVPFVPASEVSGTPSDAVHGTGNTPDALSTPVLSPLSDEGWTRLSDLVEHETEAVRDEDSVTFRFTEDIAPESPRTESPVNHPDLIVTEFIDMDSDEADEADEADADAEGPFVFAWASENVHGGDSMSPIDGIDEPVSSIRVEPSGDGASNPGSSVQMPWDESDGNLAYVYGFVPNDDASQPLGSGLIGLDSANPVRFVTVRGVRAITSMVSTDEFSPDAMSKHSHDTAWLRERIRIHARVLDAFKSTTTVVPLRFGSVYENEADVAAMIEARYSRLTETLERLAGRMEWGVRAVRNLDRMRNRVLQTERSIDESLASLSTGVAQFVRDEMSKSTDLEEASLIETVTRHCLTRVDEALSQWADDGAEKSLVPGHSGDVVMNRAYLVEQTAVNDFRAELTRLGAEFESIGLSFEMTGPWPAFHFSSLDDDHLAGSVPAHG